MSERRGFVPQEYQNYQIMAESVGNERQNGRHAFAVQSEIAAPPVESSVEIGEKPQKARYNVVSNRIPFNVEIKNGETVPVKTVGGLSIAMEQALRTGPLSREDVLWTGFLEVKRKEDEPFPEQEGLEVALQQLTQEHQQPFSPNFLTEKDIPKDLYDKYYAGFSNGVLWPWLHSMPGRDIFKQVKVLDSQFERTPEGDKRRWEAISAENEKPEQLEEAWKSYKTVNEIFAQKAYDTTAADGIIDVQDYQMLLVGKSLREKGFQGKIKHFLHIPFPKAELFNNVPHAKEIAQALLAYDQLGFQREADRNNFLEYVNTYMKDEIPAAMNIDTDGHILIATKERTTKVAAFPISIDTKAFKEMAEKDEVQKLADKIRKDNEGVHLFFSGGRKDFTKGYVESMQGFYTLLRGIRDGEEDPNEHGNPNKEHGEPEERKNLSRFREKLAQKKFRFIIAAPASRENIPSYQRYAKQFDTILKDINTEFGEYDEKGKLIWSPVEFIDRNLTQQELAAYYQTADAVFDVQKDGRNLMSLEQIVSAQVALDQDQAFIPTQILSEGAGASETATDALLVPGGPFGRYQLVRRYAQALDMSRDERMWRLARNFDKVYNYTVDDWGKNRAAA